jgi:hypothetical protein
MSDLGQQIIRRHDTLKSARANWETQWQQIAELMRPLRADFTLQRHPGERRGLEIFDSTPGLAVENLAAGLWGMVTNSANTWFNLAHPDDAVNQDGGAREWMDAVRDRMLNVFSANGQAFYSRVLDMYADLATFGTALMYVDEAEPGRIRFSARPLTECVIAQGEDEAVDTVLRKFQLTARQAAKRWGERAPAKVRASVEHRPDEKFDFIHGVFPNEDRVFGRRDFRGKAFASVTVCAATGEIVQQGGFDDFPYMVPRWSTATRGLYGESPAQLALADVKTLNVMTKTFMVASQKAADPPILAPDENAMMPVRLTPGGITYGGVDEQGRPLIRALENAGNFQLTDVMLQQKREAVREAFYASLLLMVQRPNATATEILARQEEQLRLMGPHLGRIQAELLDPLIGRVFNLMYAMPGVLPPLPPALRRSPVVQAEYVSPLARAQKASEAQAILRTVEAVAPIAQLRPEVLDNYDWDEVSRSIGLGYGIPAKLMTDRRKVEQERAARAQAAAEAQEREQMAQMAQLAPGVARAAKDVGLVGAGA